MTNQYNKLSQDSNQFDNLVSTTKHLVFKFLPQLTPTDYTPFTLNQYFKNI